MPARTPASGGRRDASQLAAIEAKADTFMHKDDSACLPLKKCVLLMASSMNLMLVYLLALLVLLAPSTLLPVDAASNCTIGVDLATPTSVSSFQCMAANGIQQVTVRAFQSNCWLDPHAPQTIQNAQAAGLFVDIYIFPSVGCDLDPTSQVEVTLNHLKANNASFNTLWLDVEDWGWDNRSLCENNQDAIRPMMQYAIQELGVERVGVYSMPTMWNRIMCNSTEWSDVLLWWAHWDGELNYNNFTAFGGWNEPFSKQYQDWGPGCLVDVDMDYRASGSCGLSEEQLRELRLERAKDAAENGLEIETDEDAKAAADFELTLPTRPANFQGGENCTIGVDLATPVSVSAFECMINEHGVQYLVVRAFQSNCYLDPHTVDTIHAAWAAGISGVDIYFFPSVGCSMDAITQFDVTMTHLQNNNASFNRIFFDVEDWEWEPQSGCATNVAWFVPLYQHAVETLGISRVGIYAGLNSWNRITCNSTLFNDSMLWYARWDKNPSFDGFIPFGGWATPTQKQYTGNDFACDIHLDFDYRSSGVC